MLKLTRYLYFKDETILSLLNSLLHKKIEESLFWISELYYSGFEIWDIIWKIYYDFYAVLNSTFENYFVGKYTIWEKNRNIVPVLDVIKNLCLNADPTPDVFCMRLLMRNALKMSPKSNIHLPKDFKYSIVFKQLFLAIYRKDYNNIAFNIKKYNNQEVRLFDGILKYIQHGLFEDIPKTSLSEENASIILARFKQHPYKNKLHMILALIFSCYRNIVINNKKYIRASANDITFVKDIHTIPCIPIYKTLACKRLYSISPHIGCFHLDRHNKDIPPYNHILWYHWEYFALSTPIWHDRFNKYNIETKEFEIIFTNDDECEDFYDKYGYEPDEQSKETQEKSILNIRTTSITDWLISWCEPNDLFALLESRPYEY